MNHKSLCYSVGALLYSPANNPTIVDSIVCQKFDSPFSLALCLEDTIRDDCVEESERKVIASLQQLRAHQQRASFYMPKIFIRVREPGQAAKIYSLLDDAKSLLTGFIFPKFSTSNVDLYIPEIVDMNRTATQTVYMMPILESTEMIDLRTRCQFLYTLKERLDCISDLVLNIRVGGNDLCHAFGYRRHCTDIIQDIQPVYQILSDIVTVFGMDYVVSGPVWEYYAGEGWDTGLLKELHHDRLNGFTGKTIIHPKQISLVNQAYQVSSADFKDASSILNWDPGKADLVSGSVANERMNEYKTHYNWAKRVLILSEIFGVSD